MRNRSDISSHIIAKNESLKCENAGFRSGSFCLWVTWADWNGTARPWGNSFNYPMKLLFHGLLSCQTIGERSSPTSTKRTSNITSAASVQKSRTIPTFKPIHHCYQTTTYYSTLDRDNQICPISRYTWHIMRIRSEYNRKTKYLSIVE